MERAEFVYQEPFPLERDDTEYRLVTQEHVSVAQNVEVLEYPKLGMEAVWKIEVEDFPAFILVDDKGNDFSRQICA
jgi:tartrate dehydratase beta subunit/fumarate hydratase class I family protein